jgi:hypothetical protein
MAPLQAPVVRHICSTRKSALLPKAAKEPASKNLFKTRQSLNKTAFLYRDSLKNPKPNTDNKGHLFVTVFELTAFLKRDPHIAQPGLRTSAGNKVSVT